MNISEEECYPDIIHGAGIIPALPGTLLSHAGDLRMPDGYPGFILLKLDWERSIKHLTILPFFSVDAKHSYAGQFVVV